MKILIFSRFFAPHIGGVEKHIQKISEILLKKGFKVVLITEKFEDNLSEQENIDGIEVYRINLFKNLNLLKLNKFLIWYWLFKNFRLIKEADIVHCHDIFFWYLPFRFLFPKKPVYITFHGWEGIFPIPKRYILARKIWEKLAWGNICVGEYLSKWYGTKPSFVSYGGAEVRKEEPKVSNKNKIVFIGRLEKDVGLPVYFKTLNILKRNKIDLEIEFCGDGALRKEAEKYGKVFGFTKNILTKITKSNFIFASSYLSIIEAMNFKRLVISVWEDLLKKDYLLLSPFRDFLIAGSDPEKISEKILYFLNHPEEEKKLVEKAYNWARTQTWEKVADLYLKLWKIKR